MRYLVHDLLDLDSGVILGTTATQATSWAERAAAEEMAPHALVMLPHDHHRKLFADAGYQAGEFLDALLTLGLTPIVPMNSLDLEPLPRWKRPPQSLDQARKRRYRLRHGQARNTVRTLLTDRRLRQQYRARIRVEHTFAEAKDRHGLGRARGRGLPNIQWQALLTATVQNLKRLATFVRRGQTPKAAALATQISSYQGGRPILQVLFRRLSTLVPSPQGLLFT